MDALNSRQASSQLVLSLFVQDPSGASVRVTNTSGPQPSPALIESGLSGGASSAASVAVNAIIEIVANGNGDISVAVASDGVVSATTKDGDDRVDIWAKAATGLYTGAGNDEINVITRGSYDYDTDGKRLNSVSRVHSGAGDDRVRLNTHGAVDLVAAGSGNDDIEIDSSLEVTKEDVEKGTIGVTRVNGEGGDDVIRIRAASMAFAVSGGDGDDVIDIQATSALGIDGGNGNDTITVTADNGVAITGGAGDDAIFIRGSAFGVNGGEGNDHIVIEGDGTHVSSVVVGQGTDLVETNEAIVLQGLAKGVDDVFDTSHLNFSRIASDTIVIGIEGRDDTVIVKFTGEMAEVEKLEFEMDSAGGLLIREAGSEVTSNLEKTFKIDREAGSIAERQAVRQVLGLPDSIVLKG